ncbi:prolyl oligopeptidase [Gracilaria domingensis]|nr:prolyl oligopeptidase [Gracilaria domingensis]
MPECRYPGDGGPAIKRAPLSHGPERQLPNTSTMDDECPRHTKQRPVRARPPSLTGASGAVPQAVVMGSSVQSPPASPLSVALPRMAAAAGIGLAVIAAEYLRRRRRGPVRSSPPVPVEKPHDVVFGKVDGQFHGDGPLIDPPERIGDPFFWMRDDERKDPHVLQHLREENAYTNYMTLADRPFVQRVYKELLSHFVETDSTVPVKARQYAYYVRTVKGKSYQYFCRKPIVDGAHGSEEIMLDVNFLARGKKHCNVGGVHVSPDDNIMAYVVDFSGYETFDIYFKDLRTGHILEQDTIRGTAGDVEWGHDNSSVYYATFDDSHRPYKLWTHVMRTGQPPDADLPDDSCLYTENDTEFYLGFGKSLSQRFLIVSSSASTLSENRFLDLLNPDAGLTLFRERKAGVLYRVSHATDNCFYVTTNIEGATNFKLMRTTTSAPDVWNEFLPYDKDVKINSVHSFKTFAVLSGRRGGYEQLWVLPEHDMQQMYLLEAEETAHVIGVGNNLEYDSPSFRYVYSSLTTPRRDYEYNVGSKESTCLKEQDVPGYNGELYKTERLEATSPDGTVVPISLVYNSKAISQDGPNKLHLYGYGSYEISIDPNFSMTRLPMLDRGVIYAIAHIRGGGEFGREWYEAARFETKSKTFEDFCACAEQLIDVGKTTPRLLSIEGRSAGGLLMGAVLNMRPELFKAAIAGVPFVDVMNTMSDPTIPLTTGEWQEWGNPHERKYFDAIKQYCPYSNVGPKPYPAVLILAGLYDPRVMYSEPMKWAAKLRKYTTRSDPILLKVDMSSGHFSASNRYSFLSEKAFDMAWVLRQLDAPEEPISS